MKAYKKHDLAVSRAREVLEPGPVVLVSSRWKGRNNIMTMNWHTVIEYSPSLVGCVIADTNFSFEMIRRSGECVLNVPDARLIDKIVGIGNCSGDTVDKFAHFRLTPSPAAKVAAPLIEECFANFECRVADTRLVKQYNFFILEVLKAQVASTPKPPRTLHYCGKGVFLTSGRRVNKSPQFTKWKDDLYF